MKVVIDTNGLLQSVPRDGSYRWLYDAFAAGEFTWVVSNEIMLKYVEMTAFYFSPVAAELVTSLLLAAPTFGRSLTLGLGRSKMTQTTISLSTVPLPLMPTGW